MRSWTLLFAAISMLALAAPASADWQTPPPAPEAATSAAAAAPVPAPDLDDPLMAAPQAAPAPAAPSAGESAPVDAEASASPDQADVAAGTAADVDSAMAMDEGMAAATTGAPTPKGRAAAIVLGPMGVDAHGHEGRIHTVARGDTLWDISEAYLGTPWVWPSIWEENAEIRNPHLINPGDRIWISSTEMRIMDDGEAEQILGAEPPAAESSEEVQPAELVDSSGVDEADLMAVEMPAALEQLPVAVPLQGAASGDTGRTILVSEREGMGFVTGETLEAATSILDSAVTRDLLASGDEFYLGLGEGAVRVGDQFTIFRDVDPVRDTDSRTLLGYHVHVLGWAEVTEVQGESSIAVVRMAHSEMQRGDRMIPREVVSPSVSVKESPDGIEGTIVYMPDSRTEMAGGDYLYINRGTLHGFEVGSELEVYDPGRVLKEKESKKRVLTPDHKVAELVIVTVQPDSAVAFVVQAHRELSVGDRVRPSVRRIASR